MTSSELRANRRGLLRQSILCAIALLVIYVGLNISIPTRTFNRISTAEEGIRSAASLPKEQKELGAIERLAYMPSPVFEPGADEGANGKIDPAYKEATLSPLKVNLAVATEAETRRPSASLNEVKKALKLVSTSKAKNQGANQSAVHDVIEPIGEIETKSIQMDRVTKSTEPLLSSKPVANAAIQPENSSFQMNIFFTSASLKNVTRVICVVVLDEAPYLKDWIDFHILAGWTKFVFYDHNSTDDGSLIVDQYPPGVIEWIPIDWPLKNKESHRSSNAQNSAYTRCVNTYWNSSQVIGNFDVDEYVFPSKPFWNASDPFEATAQAIRALRPNSSEAVAARLQCFRFGFNHLIDSPTIDIVNHYTRRAAYPKHEQEAAADIINKSTPFCKSYRLGCITYTSPKHLYFPNGQPEPIRPLVHTYSGKAAKVAGTFDDRNLGFDCNHFWVRSLHQLAYKAEKNKNDHYSDLAKLPVDHEHHEFFQAINDTLAVEYLQQTRDRYSKEAKSRAYRTFLRQ